MKYIKKYKRIVKQLITKSFLSLKNRKIRIYEKNNLKYSADTHPFISRIRVNPRLRKANETELKGIFAHELCHIEEFQKMNPLQKIIYGFLSVFKKYRTKKEKEIDRWAIKKGYAKELKAYRKFRNRFKDKNLKKFGDEYLSPKEIEDYI